MPPETKVSIAASERGYRRSLIPSFLRCDFRAGVAQACHDELPPLSHRINRIIRQRPDLLDLRSQCQIWF